MASTIRDQRRVDALFRALSSDYLLREQFVTDPAQILMEYVSGQRLEQDTATAANHLVYAMVSNPSLLRWLRSYGSESGEIPSGEAFAADFARAVARDGDEQTVMALVHAAGDTRDLFSVQTRVLRALMMALGGARGAVFSGTEMSSPGTEISPGPGTEMSPGQVFRGTEMSSPGTEISPGPGTEMSPGQVFRGTEMSSPGTEISPGPGTEMSPGRVGGIDIDVTLRALVEFANQLRRAGALSTVRFR